MHNVALNDLAVASLLVGISIAVSVWLRLRLTRHILIAAVRTVLQLSTIGLILKYIFRQPHPLLILAVVCIMTLVAGWSATSRNRLGYRGQRLDAVLSVGITSWLVTAIGLYAVLHIKPWYEPQYLIPILGMILGNTLSAVALTFDRLMQTAIQQRGQIEMLLSLGATPWEAFQDTAKQAVGAGMLPTINSMSVVGIVSLPGMMTGQILAGGNPEQAVRYQIVIMFLICAGSALGSILTAWAVFRRLFDNHACFQPNRLSENRTK